MGDTVTGTVASYLGYRDDAEAVFKDLGMPEEEARKHFKMLREFDGRWCRFDDTDKGRYVTLSNGNKTASCKLPCLYGRTYHYDGSTVRAGPWVPREGYATATVRVDRLGWGESGECKEPTVEI